MREIDRDGRMLCNIQGKIFENSVDRYGTSSQIFIRRYMLSELAERMDRPGFMDRPFNNDDAFLELDEEYGVSTYGSKKYPPEIMYWIGYIYRYWAYVYDVSSRRVYRTVKPSELYDVYLAYHTLDPINAIQRIREAKGMSLDGSYSIEEGVRILREIREAREEYKG